MPGWQSGKGGGGGPPVFSNAFKGQTVDSLKYNAAEKGSPIAVVYGTQRVAVNVIEGFGFTTSGGSNKAGGKGGSKSSKKGGPQYSVYADFGLCQGPVTLTGSPYSDDGINRVWSNGSVASAAVLPLNFYDGSDGQAPDPVFESSSGNLPVLGYSGTAHVTGTPMNLGSSPVLPNMQVEVTGFGVGTAGPDFEGDARPDWIVVDVATNARYGVGMAIADLDTGGAFDGGGSIADWGTYCQAASLAMSIVMDRQQPAARWLEEIAELTNSAVFESGGQIKIIPYAEVAVSGNDATWSPVLTVRYTLTDADFLGFGDESDPVIITTTDPQQIANWMTVEFENGADDFVKDPIPVFDQSSINTYGLNVGPAFLASAYTNQTSAVASVQMAMDRGLLVNKKYEFKIGWKHSLVEPMDILALIDSNLGLASEQVRITGIEENDNGDLTITAENLGMGATIVYPRDAAGGPAFYDPTVDPGNANPPVVFEPPPELTGGTLEVWIAATGGPNWGGCNVWISSDDTTYATVGTIVMGGRQGVLADNLPSSSDPDTTNTLEVDLSMSRAQLYSGTTADADDYVTLCFVDGELISYETATLTGPYTYDLDYLRRGAYGTPISAHSTGDNFARVGPNEQTLFRYRYPSNFIGSTIYIKLQSFNVFGQQLQDLATLTGDSYTLTGAGAVAASVVPIQFLGIPQSGAPIERFTFGNAVGFPLNLVGSVCTASPAATASTVLNIAKNGVNFATMTFGAASATATFAGTAQTFASGDVLTITPTSTDATLANLSGYLAGTVG